MTSSCSQFQETVGFLSYLILLQGNCWPLCFEKKCVFLFFIIKYFKSRETFEYRHHEFIADLRPVNILPYIHRSFSEFYYSWYITSNIEKVCNTLINIQEPTTNLRNRLLLALLNLAHALHYCIPQKVTTILNFMLIVPLL